MKNFLLLMGVLLPNRLKIFLYRQIGWTIGKNCRFGIGAIVIADNVILGDNVVIESLSFVRVTNLHMLSRSRIRSLNYINTNTFKLGKNSFTQIMVFVHGSTNPKSKIVVGDNSAIYNLTYIDPTGGIVIGNRVGIGGYGLLFTHANWGDFIKGVPRSFGSITIEDDVWVSWRVFITPGSHIEHDSIIGPNTRVIGRVNAGDVYESEGGKVRYSSVFNDVSIKRRYKNADYLIGKYLSINSDFDNTVFLEDLSQAVKGDILFFIEDPAHEILMQLEQNEIHYIIHKSYRASINSNIGEDLFYSFDTFLRSYGIRLIIERND